MAYSVTCPRCNKRHKVKQMPVLGFIKCLGCKTQISMKNDDEMDEDETYGVETKACPKCREPLPDEAVLCVDCGYNLKTKKMMRTEVEVKPVHRVWWSGTPGFHTAVELTRETDGETYLALSQHLGFIPLGRSEYNLKECKEILSDYYEGVSPMAIGMIAVLLVVGFIPGVMFWWMAAQWPTYSVLLPLENGRELILYRGWNESQMKQMLEIISETAHLRVSRK